MYFVLVTSNILSAVFRYEVLHYDAVRVIGILEVSFCVTLMIVLGLFIGKLINEWLKNRMKFF